MAILVCGGAGYVGSHTVKALAAMHSVVVLDNFSTGRPSLIDHRAMFEFGDMGDPAVLDRIFPKYNIELVIHFAAHSLVGESAADPMKYYRNNVGATTVLLEKMIDYGVRKIIFSSTAAVYGEPESGKPLTEVDPVKPISPYGRSKRMIEEMLQDLAAAGELEFIVFRYFNAAGADRFLEIGERHNPETHLIPSILKHMTNGRNASFAINGRDYATPDGTCIRDYIHVSDIANAHVLAQDALTRGKVRNEIFNLGTGSGHSVLNVVRACEKASGNPVSMHTAPRRAGDPAILVASADKVQSMLGWKARFTLRDMVESAWRFHLKTLL